MTEKKSANVAVIGAGAAGLVAVREAVREGHRVTCYEAADDVGGLWAYSDDTESDLLGTDPRRQRVHSSMYRSLRTNLPREIMGFQDFPCLPEAMRGRSRDARRYPGHEEVFEYFRVFADEFDLRRHIRLRTAVLSAEYDASAAHLSGADAEIVTAAAEAKCNGSSSAPWRLTSAPADVQTEHFDALIVAVGCYSEPNLPALPGMDATPAFQMHCHNYRSPERFAGQTVLVVGASFSGDEICRLIANVARVVYQSARTWAAGCGPDTPAARSNVVRRGMVTALLPDGTATFEGGEQSEPLDGIVYCTGYRYSFPFLTPADLICTDDNHVAPLYKHVFSIAAAPTLAFIGVPWRCLRYIQFELQAAWVARVLSGRATLPDRKAMLEDVRRLGNLFLEKKVPMRYLHNLSDAMPEDQWVINDFLAAECRYEVPAVPTWERRVSSLITRSTFQRPDRFRDEDDPKAAELLAVGHAELLRVVLQGLSGKWSYVSHAADA